MSLAATGGGMGGAGGGMSAAVMAHGGPTGLSTHTQAGQQSHHSGPPPGTTAAAPPANLAALGADLLDKNQTLNLKQIRSVANLPIVALDLYGGDDASSGGETKEEAEVGSGDGEGRCMEVAMFPPKQKGGFENSNRILQCQSLGSLSSTLYARRDDADGASHRALRRLLTKSKGYEAVFQDTLVEDAKGTSSSNNNNRKSKGKKKNSKSVTNGSTKSKDAGGVLTIPTPHLLLGARHTQYLHPVVASRFTLPAESSTSASSAVIDEEDSNVTKSSIVSVRNGNLDGSTTAQNNDYDRITLNLQLHSDKKTLSVLPEEAVSIITAQAKKLARQSSYDLSLHSPSNGTTDDDNDESYLSYPTAIALPAWACQDNTIDALSDACHGSSSLPPVLYQRPVAALVGALIPPERNEPNQVKLGTPRVVQNLEESKKKRRAKLEKEYREELKTNKGAKEPSMVGYQPTLVMAGVTGEGIEYTAVQVGSPNEQSYGDGHCPMGNLRVLASVSYRHSDPLSIAKKTLGEFTDVVDDIYPELEDDGGISSIVTYGTVSSQVKLTAIIRKTLGSIQGEDGKPDAVWNNGISFTSTRDETVALGTAVLAAVSYGRIEGEPNASDEKRMRPAVQVQNVAPCAVGIVYNFEGGREGTKWTEPKVVFDFDRRVPTMVHKIDFSASECVAIRKDPSLLDNEEKLYDEGQKWAKGRYNQAREEAAMDLRVKVVQRVERGGEWQGVGDVFHALTRDDDEDGAAEEDGEKKRMPVETAMLEMSLDSVGYINATLSSDGQSIVQAVKSARSTSFWWYFRAIAAILFFGGFFLKSFLDEQTRKHDVKKILAFYKNVAPGSISDGDENNANYLCWKYKGRKARLWRKLESKYGHPVKEIHEWPEEEENKDEVTENDEEEKPEQDNEDEEEDLDKDEL